jgi:hypothetical protein
MKLEQEPRGEIPMVSIETIAAFAETTTLENGGHVPTMIVFGETDYMMAPFLEMPDTHEARWQLMFWSGFALASSKQLGILKKVFFISEAWMSSGTEQQKPVLPPTEDPDRREVLIIAGIEMEGRKAELKIFEIGRDEEGQLIDLARHEPTSNQDDVENPLLLAFVDGFLEGTGGLLN